MKYSPIPLEEIRAAQKRIAQDVTRTPLVKLNVDDAPAEIYLKLENLTPIRSFKIRPASNALRLMTKEQLEKGVWTSSAGNFAQGLAWVARKLGVKCTVALSENVPRNKLEKIQQLGAQTIQLPSEEYTKIYTERTHKDIEGTYVHPSSDLDVMAGGGTIGLEILEELPDVDSILVPWGIGGLTCGIASAVHAVNPEVKVYACDEGNLTTALNADKSEVTISDDRLLQEVYDFGKQLFDGTIVTSAEERADAIKMMIERNCVVAEDWSARTVAAALSGRVGTRKIVCVITGGNIDISDLVKILQGKTPQLSH